jgi:cell division protein FtsW
MRVATTILVFCVTALLALGMVMLYSSSMADPVNYLRLQIVWCLVGLAGCVVAANVDYRLLKRLAWPLFGVTVLMLVLVLSSHVGYRTHGARRWFRLPGGVLFQPSELAKMALIIAVAWYGERYQRRMDGWKHGMLIPCLFIGVILGLIFVEPDRGTTILMAAVTGMMLLLAGMRWKFTVPPALLAIAAGAVSLLRDSMRMGRIQAWLNPDDPRNKVVGYQAQHGILALGAGGWTGLGLGNSREKLGFLPEHNTDFIFSIIGEELGLIATLLVVLAFVLLLVCGLYISHRAADGFGLLLGAGITILISLQAFINIGVNTNTLPNKGMPLPFISYGGSNLLIMLTSVGLLLSIARRARTSPAARLEPGEMPSPQLP